jgi:DNA-binding LacI/PurR family transcriptional regulator
VTCREFVADVQAGQLAGIVAIAALPNPAWVESARKQQIPAVGSPTAFPAGVKLDYPEMIADGVRRLLDAGRTRLALLGWRESSERLSTSAQSSTAVFKRTVEEAGIAPRDGWLRDSLHPALSGAGWEEFREIWGACDEKPDGLLITDDMLFNDVKAAILELGISVPEQLMVVTHANRGTRYHYPFPVVTLECDPEQYGETLADQAVVLAQGKKLPEPVITLRHRVRQQTESGSPSYQNSMSSENC